MEREVSSTDRWDPAGGEATRLRPPFPLIRGLWGGVIVLAAIGVAAAVGRGVFPGDLAAREEPVRQRILQALDRDDPFESQRARELDLVDGRFGAHPAATLLHVLPGAVFLLLAPLQFSARIRGGHLQFHRWSGRLLVLAGFVTALAGLYFGLLMPYGGWSEAIAVALFGGLFLYALSRALLAIRKHQVARHREWMIRAFAVAIGISTVRVIAAILDLTLSPAGFAPPVLFVLSIWTGWALTLGAAELWIRHTLERGRVR